MSDGVQAFRDSLKSTFSRLDQLAFEHRSIEAALETLKGDHDPDTWCEALRLRGQLADNEAAARQIKGSAMAKAVSELERDPEMRKILDQIRVPWATRVDDE